MRRWRVRRRSRKTREFFEQVRPRPPAAQGDRRAPRPTCEGREQERRDQRTLPRPRRPRPRGPRQRLRPRRAGQDGCCQKAPRRRRRQECPRPPEAATAATHPRRRLDIDGSAGPDRHAAPAPRLIGDCSGRRVAASKASRLVAPSRTDRRSVAARLSGGAATSRRRPAPLGVNVRCRGRSRRASTGGLHRALLAERRRRVWWRRRRYGSFTSGSGPTPASRRERTNVRHVDRPTCAARHRRVADLSSSR